MSDHYLAATALGGRLYWDDTLPLQNEAVVDMFVNPRFGHRKVRTEEDFQKSLEYPNEVYPQLECGFTKASRTLRGES